MKAILETRDLVKYYGKGDNLVKAIDHTDLIIEPGEFTAIVGRSGSGKSTLLHMLGGLDRPDSGKVLIEGRDIFKLKDEKQAFTLKDYEKVDEITDGQTFLYVVLPQFYSYKNENYEFVMILVDYKKLDLKNGYTYWGNGLQDIMNCEMNPIPQLEKKQMPTKIAELNWKTETDEIKLKKCVVAPITYMEQYKEEISSAAIHVEWKKKYLKNEEKTIQKIETYLYNSHDQSFRYRIYSPEIELRNNTIKVMTSLQAINKVALLFMAVFLTGMIAIYQLRFEHREESYGISLAYGAQYKELYWEIFCEILLLNSIGTIIGIVIGYLVTYYVDFGIMISVVNVQGSWYTFLSAYGLCVVLSSFVSVITFRKLKKKKIIELLNVY